jgi:DNA-binding response OmpR family regulator
VRDVSGRRDTSGLRPLQIVVIDRDRGFLAVLRKRLERRGWSHRVLATSPASSKLASMHLDAIVVDLAAVGRGYWGWLARVCQRMPHVAVIVCTGGSTPTDRVRALRIGADDWLSKPCHPEELIARLEAVVRGYRSRSSSNGEPSRVGELEIHGRYQVAAAGRPLRLTRRECQLLKIFVTAGDVVLDQQMIYEHIWGHRMKREDRSVDVYVHKLRKKLAVASPRWRYIHTQHGRGYRFAAEPLAARVRALPEREAPGSSGTTRLAA